MYVVLVKMCFVFEETFTLQRPRVTSIVPELSKCVKKTIMSDMLMILYIYKVC